MSQINKENLFKAQGSFLEAMRAYIVSVLMKEAGDQWAERFVECLTPQQRDSWAEGLRNNSSPESLIDFHHLRGFSLHYKELLRDDFGKKTNSLPTLFDAISLIRHRNLHFQDVSEDEYNLSFIHMKDIARQLKMDDLLSDLELLHSGSKPISEAESLIQKKISSQGELAPWFAIVKPHYDIRQGHLDESVFAANLAEVALGNGREIYLNPTIFFSKTYFTQGLKTISRRVIKGLNGEKDAENRVMSLQTGFGGGKTHVLISLYHLVRLGKSLDKMDYIRPILDYTGIPMFDKANIAVFTNTTNDVANGRYTSDGLHIQTIWGELAWQLGGKAAYEILRKNDESLIAPAGLFKKVLELTKPALILIDELADYCVKASARRAGDSTLADQTISFVQELTQAVSETDRSVLVATLPASATELAQSEKAAQILNILSNRLGRVGADTKPVDDEEIFEVIRARLFEDLGSEEARQSIINSYSSLYHELWSELPSGVTKMEYKEKLLKSYPFHPELIDVFRKRWASHHDFQRTRGVLRLLASIVSDLWKRQQNLLGSQLLIHTSDVNFSNLDALTGQLKKLYGYGYDAVITADVSGSSSNAFKIDQDKTEYGKWNLTQGLAATILLSSFGGEGGNKGLSISELKLCLIKPRAFNHNNINGALDEMEGKAHYLYYSTSGPYGKHYWFHTKPNINILINQAKTEIDNKLNIIPHILDRVQTKTRLVQLFKTLVNPSGDVPEQKEITLVILSPAYQANGGQIGRSTKDFIENLATKKGNTERIFRNTMLFLVCSEMAISKLHDSVKEFLASKKILEDYQGQLDSDQKEKIQTRLKDAEKNINRDLAVAYSIVIKYKARGGLQVLHLKNYTDSLETQINTSLRDALKEEEWLLGSIGMNTLRSNNLLPSTEKSIRVKDIYEAFLRYDDKPMITGLDAVQQSLLRYCQNGEYAIATGEEGNFKSIYYKQSVPYFDVTDETYWLVDKGLYQPPAPLPRQDEGLTTTVSEKEKSEIKKPEEILEVEVKKFRSITISGKVDMANYSQVFTSFINPLSKNNVEIEIKIKGKSTQTNPITENSQQYKITKESANQLGLEFQEEE
jgi:predicted AAA+ superfamily ATPase